MSEISWPITGTIDGGTSQFSVIEGISVPSLERHEWMVVVGGILAFAMAWGIGANDVANAFATSVGAGSLSLKWACVIAAVMEFLGAFLLGGSVTDTVRKKIIDGDVFDPAEGGAANGPELLMTGFLVALFAATTWLIIATFFSLPVSTTHSVIGALVGVGLAYRGGSAVIWIGSKSGLKSKLGGLVGVIISWIISPILSGILAVLIFFTVRSAVLRRKNPYRSGLLFMPFLYGFTIAITIFFIIYKGDKRLSLSDKLSVGEAIGIALGSGAGVALFSWFLIVPLAKRSVERWEAREIEKAKNPEIVKEAAAKSARVDNALSKVGINVNVKEELGDDVLRMHDNVEKFDGKTEQLFTWIQIFTAAFDSFAHGANDVANAIAPFASVFQLQRNNGQISKPLANEFESSGQFSGGGDRDGQSFEEEDPIPDHAAYCGELGGTEYFSCNSGENVNFPYLQGFPDGTPSAEFDVYGDDGVRIGTESQTCYTQCNPNNATAYDTNKQDVPLWILALGGLGIVAGLAMWGYRIIVAIGVKLTKLTPSRGFSIEIGAAITVLIASRIGLPVSTTHCQVGATMGVGLIEFKSSTVNWRQFLFICIGWVFTVVFTGFLSAGIFAVITQSPLEQSVPQELDYCPGANTFIFNEQANAFQGVGCAGFETP